MGSHQKQIYLTSDRLCRTCMYSGADVISLFDVIDIGEKRETLSSILVKCTSIQVTRNDIFPQQICQICLKRLLDAFLFREDCHKIHRKFEELFQSQTTLLCDNVLDTINNDTGNVLAKNDCISNNVSIQSATNSKSIHVVDEINVKVKPERFEDICVESDRNITEETELADLDFKYACSKCDKTFWTEHTWKMHDNVHAKRKLTKCGVCGKAFTRPADVKRHMSVHTGLKPYTCAICQASFTQSGSLATHMKKHDEFKGLNTNKKKMEQMAYLCSHCGKEFKHCSSLITHVRGHNKDKPYFCTVCDMRRTATEVQRLWQIIFGSEESETTHDDPQRRSTVPLSDMRKGVQKKSPFENAHGWSPKKLATSGKYKYKMYVMIVPRLVTPSLCTR
ncbi:unnamed protein product [Acanthoscelides obtectus]|uniref:Uncharacterized protein n=1 Tax=Acanthoscelides obtectus TaxID=200917 RepID=A0A9P0LWG2_ACAOB|nr:unnamed protein product [Acanthoscelides obtectus]CAK1659287.1 Zinc finger protein 16 [Acanthoscelides obtectus]